MFHTPTNPTKANQINQSKSLHHKSKPPINNIILFKIKQKQNKNKKQPPPPQLNSTQKANPTNHSFSRDKPHQPPR
jgi:hypothetical protein